tara:strand:- start:4925 stop:6136 length:1212 start_codon:yes stop_codon:yes gene_type:complete
MENIIDRLQEKFLIIRDVHNESESLNDEITTKVSKIKEMYLEFVENNNNKQLFIFGLDTLHFQHKFFNKELEHIKEYRVMILNRIYCEYYKMFKLIEQYIHERNIDEECPDINKVNIDFDPYDDLKPDKEYSFDNIIKLNDANFKLLTNLLIMHKQKNNILKDHEHKNSFGINIDNFVISYSHNTMLLREKILLFERYILFFYELHEKLLTRFLTRCKLLYGQMNHDIKFDDKKNDVSEKQQKKFLKKIRRESGVDDAIIQEIEQSISVHIESDDESTGSINSPVNKTIIPGIIKNPIKEEIEEISKTENAENRKVDEKESEKESEKEKDSLTNNTFTRSNSIASKVFDSLEKNIQVDVESKPSIIEINETSKIEKVEEDKSPKKKKKKKVAPVNQTDEKVVG